MNRYNHHQIEKKWQERWSSDRVFSASNLSERPKFYVLDMFPYPSGEGLHVGHPLGYISSDVFARYKRGLGFNVLHPIGFDAFGLPAEQYAIQTGQKPQLTTAKNIARYTEQLKKIGLSYDWEREITTSDPSYYRWTQFIFSKLFDSWYDNSLQKARPIEELVKIFEVNGNHNIDACCALEVDTISAAEWLSFSKKEKSDFLFNYRIAYRSEASVNWCPELGTVLSNDEVRDGVSERGGYPVEQKKMQQWMLRLSAYSGRLLDRLKDLDWSDSVKLMQQNWIGKSEGALIDFVIDDVDYKLTVFSTKPETLFGVSFIAISKSHEITKKFLSDEKKEEINRDLSQTNSENFRGVFLDIYAKHPITNAKIPIWVADYVLEDYGTGSLMGVPAHDERDYGFAMQYNLDIINIIDSDEIAILPFYFGEAVLKNSHFLNGLSPNDAKKKIIQYLEEKKLGKGVIKYRLRDAIFGRQRYWGEPIPIYYDEDGVANLVPLEELPLKLPDITDYKPSSDGKSPLAKCKTWYYNDKFKLETDTMPGWAGSSWYFLRYIDPHNEKQIFDNAIQKYWSSVDLYVGGAEHTTGHLIYARFWTKFLYDLGFIDIEEPFVRMLNQGMILGKSSFIYRIKNSDKFISADLKDNYDTIPTRIFVELVHNSKVNLEKLKNWRPDFANAEFLLNDKGDFLADHEVEKMSKSKFNTVTPDSIIDKYGADTLRLYTLFLGPVEMHKPWDINGIEGTYRFLNKLWRLFHTEEDLFYVDKTSPSDAQQRILHKTIKKVHSSIQTFSFNTAISAFMIAVNDLSSLKCNNYYILSSLIKLLSPFAPHICEELWQLLGNTTYIALEMQPNFDEKFLIEDFFDYPVTINGKLRFKIRFDLGYTNQQIEHELMQNPELLKWLDAKQPKQIIIVQNKIINVVL